MKNMINQFAKVCRLGSK